MNTACRDVKGWGHKLLIVIDCDDQNVGTFKKLTYHLRSKWISLIGSFTDVIFVMSQLVACIQ